MPCVVQEDMHLTALWKADDGIPYCVVHLLENAHQRANRTHPAFDGSFRKPDPSRSV